MTRLLEFIDRYRQGTTPFNIIYSGSFSSLVNSLKAFNFSLTKNMVRGDSYCEWVVERKK